MYRDLHVQTTNPNPWCVVIWWWLVYRVLLPSQYLYNGTQTNITPTPNVHTNPFSVVKTGLDVYILARCIYYIALTF